MGEKKVNKKPVRKKKEQVKTSVKNVSAQNWMAFDVVLAPGETYKPGKAQLKRKRAMAKIARAVELKKLEWV